MKELIIATRNNKKRKELARLLKGTGISLKTLNDFKGLAKIKEDGATFRANARKKALGISSKIGELVLADDSGLEVYALGKAPGINSARFAGPQQNDDRNIAKLLKSLKGIPPDKRKAQFRCVIAVSKGRRIIGIVEGRAKGQIAKKRSGSFGFGYDPVFIPRGYKKTFAQMRPSFKNRISHRAKALKKAKLLILKYLRKYS